MTLEQKFESGADKFPVGMRVLAVDDDPACLKLLEALLRKCQYHVTTTNQAALALQMLRENKDNFDLVICDVCMPDMDGFKLLELMGIDLDLPVIMLSAYGDTATVTKGIRYGACDYLLKPVRLEALKLIWQHVVRKKIDKKRPCETDKVGDGFADQNGKLMRKRKDQYENDENIEHEEDKDKNSDSSTPKKQRIVWTGELHRKFVAAVDYLGIDAVPKSILLMMNEEKLTREHVASHLQKYRQYLKRISAVANQEANVETAPWGRSDSTFLQTGTVNLPTFVGFDNPSSRLFPRNTVLGRLNSPARILGTSSSRITQGSNGQTSTDPISQRTNFQSFFPSENHNEDTIQGAPLPLDPSPSRYTQNVTDESMFYPSSSVILDSSSYSVSDTYSNLLMNQPTTVLTKPLSSEFPSHLLDFERGYENWSTAVQSSSLQSSSYALNDSFNPQVEDEGKDPSSNGGEQSSSMNPLSIRYNEDHFEQMMMSFGGNPQNSVGSLEDVVTAMTKERKGKLTMSEAHLENGAYSRSISNCIYT